MPILHDQSGNCATRHNINRSLNQSDEHWLRRLSLQEESAEMAESKTSRPPIAALHGEGEVSISFVPGGVSARSCKPSAKSREIGTTCRQKD